MGEKTLPVNFKVCATCACWTGRQTPNQLLTTVSFDEYAKGKCMGGAFHMLDRPPMQSCNKWQGRWG